jgi:hypothetical protein
MVTPGAQPADSLGCYQPFRQTPRPHTPTSVRIVRNPAERAMQPEIYGGWVTQMLKLKHETRMHNEACTEQCVVCAKLHQGSCQRQLCSTNHSRYTDQ